MSGDDDVPAHVLRFVDEYLDSVPQLETLLMMSRAHDRGWLAADVASRNYIDIQRAQDILNGLQRRGLVSFEPASHLYTFDPATEEIRALVAELARCYQKNLSRISVFIHSKASASVKEFARAFDFKKER